MESRIQCGGSLACPDCEQRFVWGPGSYDKRIAEFKTHRLEHLAELTERTW